MMKADPEDCKRKQVVFSCIRTLRLIRLKLTISDVDGFKRRMKAQREAFEIYGDDFVSQAPLWSKRTQILRDGLIGLDCLELGMSQREIAIVLHGQDAVNAGWADDRGAMKDAIRYLVNKAQGLRDGGYPTELLGGQLGPYQKAA